MPKAWNAGLPWVDCSSRFESLLEHLEGWGAPSSAPARGRCGWPGPAEQPEAEEEQEQVSRDADQDREDADHPAQVDAEVEPVGQVAGEPADQPGEGDGHEQHPADEDQHSRSRSLAATKPGRRSWGLGTRW